MADISLVSIDDDLPDGIPKINEGIKNANEALKRSYNADMKSNTAEKLAKDADVLSKSVQVQLDKVVLEGDSSVEAAQARVDAFGNTSDTLKKRLDEEQIERLKFQAMQMKTKDDNVFELIAHRGFSNLAPENTMVATKLAAKLGATSLECDVQISSDGIPVVIHDDTVDRTTNGTGKVVEKSFFELRQLDAAKNFPYFSGEKIPSFEEWLQFAKGNSKIIYPEIKGYREQADINIMIDLIVKYGLESRCVIQSTYPLNLEYVRSLNNQITLGYLINDLQAFDEALVHATKDRNSMLLPNVSLVYQNQSLIQKARLEGIDIAVWTVNSLEYMQRIKNLGVSRFMSDNFIKGGEVL